MSAAADDADDESERRAAFASARARCRRDGGSASGGAFLASFFLPRHRRDGVHAVWAFARLIEQAVRSDEPAGDCGSGGACGGGSAVAALLKSRVDAMYDVPRGELPLPQFRDQSQWVMLATVTTNRRFDVPRGLWHGLIDGLVAFNGVERVATWRSLDAHLASTGGNVGRLVAAVLGATHSDAASYAAAIGRAARFTSILRDLKRDVARGRVLLPLEDLARFRYSERELLAATLNDNFRSLVRHQVARGRALFHEGAAGTPWLDGNGSRMAAGALVALQLAQLDAIEREPELILRNERAIKPPSLATQLRQLPRAWRIAIGSAGAGREESASGEDGAGSPVRR
jgi:phytoene synthase